MQRGETRRKRKNKRLGRLQQVGPSGSQENSPPNSESSEVLHVRPARPAKLSVIRQHASIPEDDEILEELPSIQVRSGWANQQKAHSPVSERKESQDSYAQSQRRQSQDSYAQSQRRQSEDSYAQSQQRRQSIRSQDLSDAPSTIHSIKDEEDQHSRHVRFKSPQVSARSIASMRHSTVSNDHSRENGTLFTV
uniref:Uncharacterized protein n=1 Tax=Plectus sambesii TaxID=2011161 RepID=A0A914UJW4_9BILA